MSADLLPHTACIGLGSNLGNSRRLLMEAWQVLGGYARIRPLSLSAPYRTKPVAMDSRHWFVNAAGLLHTSLTAPELLARLHKVEAQFGRVRNEQEEGYRDRTLDLDLLLFDETVYSSPSLCVPHPALHKRGFVLVPLAEIAPDLRHPLLQKTVAELLQQLKAAGQIGDVRQEQWDEQQGNCLK